MADYDTALQLDPNLAQAYVARANLQIQKKNYHQAVSDLETAVQMKSKKLDWALNSLAWLRATCPEAKTRGGKEAVELAMKACELSQWKNWSFIDTLAAAYAEAGDFDHAVTYQNQALQMTQTSSDHSRLEQRLSLYKEHQAYREEPN
jgi:Flp pilus assembly protein TadD